MNEMNELTLQTVLYEIYRESWMCNNVSPRERFDTFRNYKLSNACEKIYESYDDYLLDNNGFGGSLYVCFGEFLDSEYLDKEFIEELIRGSEIDDDLKTFLMETYEIYSKEYEERE